MSAARKKAGKRNDKGSAFRAEFIEQLQTLVIDGGMVNQRGEIALGKIAKFWKVSAASIRNWRNPQSESYKKEFADAWKKCEKAAHAGIIKQGLIAKAEGRAKSISITTQTTKGVVVDRNGDEHDITTVTTVRNVIKHAPDVPAAKVCLQNLGRAEASDEKWNVKEQVEQSGKIEHTYSAVELAAAKKAGIELAKAVRKSC